MFTGLATKQTEESDASSDPLAGWYWVGQDLNNPLPRPIPLHSNPAAAAFCMSLLSIYDGYDRINDLVCKELSLYEDSDDDNDDDDSTDVADSDDSEIASLCSLEDTIELEIVETPSQLLPAALSDDIRLVTA